MKKALSVLLVLALVCTSVFAQGQQESNYPNKNINMTVPYGAGGTTDLTARALANAMGKDLGVTINIVNTAGAGGSAGIWRTDPERRGCMIIKSAELETVCGITSALPVHEQPEFAFAGKSNVGKSSLINALMNRKSLARTSAQPGKTQTINFYNINGELYYVDLPGYGYAKVPLAEKEKWGKMIENYLHRSRMLKCVFLLVDIRHEPSANDRMMYEWMVHNGFRPVIIATKLDKINRSQIQKQVRLIRTGLGMEKEDLLFPFSAQTKQGREEIWNFIEKMTSGDGQGEEAPKRELESKTEEKQG